MPTSTLRRIFKAFQYRDFRLMWIGACASSIGTWMQIVAQGWLIYRLSHSAFLLGADRFLSGLPIFLFTIIGGVVADRFERRKILLMSQWLQMASAATLTVLVAVGVVHVWEILCLSFVSGFAQAFGGPAYSALIPTLVEPEDMPNAIALNSIQFNLAVTVGPALAGIALAKLGEKWCFGLNALSFLAPIISLSIISTRFVPESTKQSMLKSLMQGIKFIWHQGSMVGLIVLAFLMTFLGMSDANVFSRVCERYFSSRARDVWILAFGDGSGIDLRVAGDGGIGQHAQQGAVRADDADLPGLGDFRVFVFEVAAAELYHAVVRRRVDDGGVRHGDFAGAADHDQRNARAGDERLQLRLSRRDADGESAVRMAGSHVYGADRAGCEWNGTGSGGGVFSAGAAEGRGTVTQPVRLHIN